ncbi:glycosyl transferase family 2 [Acuticoccus sediminis]|uniref:Glycosyl transferase family 2 n=1 Tax=Acuticoccus sediminis TaxID=2184697 RepID=A0A8B2NL27_9HYPH|nr:glycosyltransferase family 2 protein [Acuticoccus sediminis]RAH98795.1 glycosyl transferase family 2 [Acuticoccus sediminis]
MHGRSVNHSPLVWPADARETAAPEALFDHPFPGSPQHKATGRDGGAALAATRQGVGATPGTDAEAATALTVIVVSYNTQALTLRCLETLYATTAGADMEVIVVDNASSDGSADAIAARFPAVRLMALDRNVGFAAANNLAAEDARGTYILLLNPDTEVFDGAIANIMAFAEATPNAGIWGGRTVFPDGSLNIASCWNRITLRSGLFTALGLNQLFKRSSFFNAEKIGGWRRDTVRDVDIVVGCFLLIRHSLWRELGGFDLRYFMYGEDSDLCLRARRLGHRPMITPDATIMHLVGASTRQKADKVVMVAKAKATLVRDHWSPHLVPVGLFFLWLWCANRHVGSLCLSVLPGSAHRKRKEYWSSVWRRRRDWLGGYAG